jgi:hypothetical protein
MRELDAVRRQYREFADTECRGYSDLYYRLARGAAEDETIMRFIADRPVRQPNLFLAAVHYVTGTAGMPSTVAALKALLEQRGADVAALMADRRTQTNEVGRCAVLLPALPVGPLALVEVGASAGLCLLLDRFSYDYGSARLGLPASPVRLRCALAGTTPLPLSTPEVVWRRGLDIAPLDVYDEEAVRWLLACVWPDHPERRHRLEAAVAIARADPPCVRRGDLVDDLACLLAEAPHAARLVVFTSAVLGYVSPERREAFEQVLANTSSHREIVWVSNEPLGVLARLATSPTAGGRQQFLVARKTFVRGVARSEVLALVHPHGSEMTWLAGAG